ncbi:AAA family ATPase [Bacillus sp. DTU_2020_1000418_1_SI_GHA_SEK_038]|uniref:McrB family protein n=1 Tax=Bacillus sp. DTU_2020_1000418_1_SI_GHA_SEK_038 TaxID=3077585 RepID=UPI0028E3568E|nr:AAA family ATPase [Bacillus sp. DTU_2020_1000418_1_SI_GHA_SEK_038]WNS76666.1 AAA family ATPase [Bacillus sp. DTU_2020_1000418_1_SI_GHA_SEK_038]
MSKFYISKDDVLQSIEYFKNLNIDNDSMLPAFLIAKHLGISLRRPVTFSNVSPEQKTEILGVIWQLGGLQGKEETSKKRSVLFSNSFKADEISSSDFYQAGTDFTGLVGRIKDTVEKKNINVQLFVDNNKLLTLSRKYKEIINENYLKGQKISLKHFACWVFRFIDFDFKNVNPDEKEFTRVVSKAIRSMFKITKKDFLWLFEDDVLSDSITPSSTIITASDIRDEFTFKTGAEPEIFASATVDPIQAISVDKEQVEKYIQMSGDNPTDEQIYQTLLQTKQIVLTGVPGVGKSRFLNNLRKKFDHTEMIQFHANYSYEEFIGGDTIESSSVISKKGKFLSFVEKAKNDEEHTYLFIIDELNRGNIAQIFGETILTLDRGYSVDLAKAIDGVETFSIPNNIYIACSMNTSDRNIAFLDLAIRRRFAFLEMQPNYELLSSVAGYGSFDLGDILKTINTRILNALGREELLLGHSYFLSDSVKTGDKFVWTDETLHLQFNFVILPTLREYTLSNRNALVTILGEQLGVGLLEIDEFVEAFSEEFGNEL